MDDFTEIANCNDCTWSTACFRQKIPDESDFINRNKTQIRYNKGENICKEKAYASNILYLADGLVKVYLESPENRHININILKTSEFIGLSSLYGDNIHHYSAVALVDCTICMINKENFQKILLEHGQFASDIIQWYCQREKQLFGRIKSLGHKQMNGRLADVLFYLCDESFDQKLLFSQLTRKDIADFAGISTESAVRVLTEFKTEGIIELDGKMIRILDPKKLFEISKYG